MNLSDKVNRAKEIPWQQIESQVVLLNPKQNMAHELNVLGSEIWHLLNETSSLSVIHSNLLKEYEVESLQLENDILKFVNEMIELDLLERVSNVSD